MNLEFGRLITAMITPFNTDGSINIEESLKVADYLIATGTDTLLLAGTTGESPTLTFDEELLLFKAVVAHCKGRAKVMAGTGSNCTRTAVNMTQKAEQCGVDAFLQVVPYYNKPSQAGMIAHFKEIAKSTKKPILLYNIPGRTGVNMEPETMKVLSAVENIIGVKEAAGSVDQVKQIRSACPNDFLIYSGDDGLTVDFMQQGACGVVSVAAHLIGDDLQTMMAHASDGNIEAAQLISKKYDPLFDVLFITSNPSPVKAALALKGYKTETVRLPLVKVSEEEHKKVKTICDQFNLLN
ncbi:4-hydroxy-tetrahydrodipicolinate synthase [Candidatus Marinamargulisbacteria bacterium SCGC AAA071-K20]|nr:4-hydroxy-tetrahydrodipicolinate synthase [Candidatus Marinamargulisbacteria bacterium SCGC AAA071-K20]